MKVSVFFYAHNQENFVKKGIASIFHQIQIPGFEYELVVIDDGSSDGTAVAIEEALHAAESQGLALWDIQFIKRSNDNNLGQSGTLKQGLGLMTGDYIAILEGDDYWISNRHLVNLVESLERFPSTPAAFASWISHDRGFNHIETRSSQNLGQFIGFNELIAYNAPATLSACMYRRSSLRDSMEFISKQTQIADWGINLHVSLLGPLFWHPDVSLAYLHLENSLWRKIGIRDKSAITADLLEIYAQDFPEPSNMMAKKAAVRIRRQYSFMGRIANAVRHPFATVLNLISRVARDS